MKATIRIVLIFLATAGAGFGGELVLTGNGDHMPKVALVPRSATTIEVTIPMGVDRPKMICIGATSELEDATPEHLKYAITFAGSYSMKSAGNSIVISDSGETPPKETAVAAVNVKKEKTAEEKAAEAAQLKKPAEAKKDKAPEVPTLSFGHTALQLPGQSSLKDRKPSYDAAIPESPAATILGSNAKIVRFTETKDAVTQLLNVADDDGNLSTGFSFAVHPYRVLAHPTLDQYTYGSTIPADLDDQSGGKWVRFLSRLDISLAASVDDEANAKGQRGATGAIGLSGFVFNLADSRLALAKAIAPLGNNDTFTDPNLTAVTVSSVPADEFAAAANSAYASLWNNSYWAFGYAPRFRSDTGSFSDFKSQGNASWTTLGYGFEHSKKKLGLGFLEDNAQILLHASYRASQRVAATSTVPAFEEDVWIYGAQLRIGGDGFNAFGEILWEKHRPDHAAHTSSETYYFGIEKRLTEALWLQVSIGSEAVPQSSDRSALLMTALSYGFGDQSLKPSGGK